jgi:hypothetical protein
MIGAHCWFFIDRTPIGGVIVGEAMKLLGDGEWAVPGWQVQLDIPMLCSQGCLHTHATAPKGDVHLES